MQDLEERQKTLKRHADEVEKEAQDFIIALDALLAKVIDNPEIFKQRNSLVTKLKLLMQDQAEVTRERTMLNVRLKLEEIYRAW